ncbi:MAG: putative sulfate exporter family transporter [Pseudomonadota bacterium]
MSRQITEDRSRRTGSGEAGAPALPRGIALAALVGLALGALWFAHPALALSLGAVFALATDQSLGWAAWLGKYLLQGAVVLLALRLDLREVVEISGTYLPAVAGYVVLTLIGGLILGLVIRVERQSAQLVAAGTAICGGTAVASLAPVIGARSEQIAPVLALIFLLNCIALLSLPWVGQALDMTQTQFGVWVALAVHDTSSVVGTAAAYGEEALAVATTVKLGRTLWLIPLLALWGLFASGSGKLSVPGFVVLFVLVAFLNGVLGPPEIVGRTAGVIGAYLIAGALFCVGLDLRRETLRQISPRLLVLALTLWFVVLPLTWLVATRG